MTEKKWRIRAQLAFILFTVISGALVVGIIQKFEKPDFNDNDLIKIGVFWLLSLIHWMGLRWYYRLRRKNESNKIR